MEETEQIRNILINKAVIYGAPDPDSVIMDYSDYEKVIADLTTIDQKFAEAFQSWQTEVADRDADIAHLEAENSHLTGE